MSWTPPVRPAWVSAANRGEVPLIVDEARRALSRDELLGEALARRGEEDRSKRHAAFGHAAFPAEPFVLNLDRLTHALEAEASLTLIGRALTRRFLLRLLEVRLQLMRHLRVDPGVQEERIAAPLFVAGAPRTGTTILHALLAADPRLRAPEGWELLRPVPPPDPDPERLAADPRIALADRELIRPQTVVSGLEAIHVYGARKPKECLSAMSFALQSEEFTARYHVPSYARWLESSDMRPAYAMHRLVLQILQRRRPGTAWVRKSPVHLHSLPTLLETYPDARVAITHRDPATFLGSLTSLIGNLRWAHSDRVDAEEIARAHQTRYQRSLEALVEACGSPGWPVDRVHHSLFADFLADPIAVVEDLYARFGLPFDKSLREAMEVRLASQPRNEHGPHRYAPLAFHDARDESDGTRQDPFARYRSHFSIPHEARPR